MRKKKDTKSRTDNKNSNQNMKKLSVLVTKRNFRRADREEFTEKEVAVL